MPVSPPGVGGHQVDLDGRQHPEHLVGDRRPPEPGDRTGLAVGDEQMGGPAAAEDVDQAVGGLAGLDADDLGAEVLGVVDVLAQVAFPVERAALVGRRLDDDGQEWRMEGAGQGSPATERGAADRGLVDRDRDSIGDGPPSHAGARSDLRELLVDLPGDEAEGELPERGQVRLGEEPVERDLGPLGRVDVAVTHPLAERVRAHVDELDLVGERRGPRRAVAR